MTYCRSQRQYRNKHGHVPVTRAPNLSYCWHLDLIVSCFRDALHTASEAVPLDLIHSMSTMSCPLHYWRMCVRVSADIAKCSSEIKPLQLQTVQKFYKSQPIPSCLQSWASWLDPSLAARRRWGRVSVVFYVCKLLTSSGFQLPWVKVLWLLPFSKAGKPLERYWCSSWGNSGAYWF